jgi:hypothetical protein
MKKYIFLSIIIVISSCSKDWLELKQPGNNDDVYFVDGATAFEAVVAAYDVQAWRENVNALWVVGAVMSDDAIKGGESPGDQQGMYDCQNFAHTPNTDVPYWIWRDLYKMVARASFAVDIMVEKDENDNYILEMDDDLRKRYIAECRFLRAYSYFRLVRNFGGVMLYTSREDDGTSHGEDTKSSKPRASVLDVYSQIEADLNYASLNLPETVVTTFDQSDLGRATKGAANGLLAKVYLYHAQFDPSKWANARAQCELVINSGLYGLEPNYADIFTSGKQWGQEVVWALHMTEDLDGNWWEHEGSWVSIFFGDRDMGWGYGFNNPTQDFVDAFELGDERKEASIVFDGEVIPNTFSDVPHDFNGGSWNPETGYLCQKYLIPDNERPITADCNSNLDYIFLRYADILLMHAEACMETGDPTSAQSSIALVRQRAGLSPYPDAATIATYKEKSLLNHEDLKAVIYHERRVELGLEHDRFYDLVRWGDAGIVFQNFSDNGNDYGKNNFVIGCSELLPIPGDDVNNSGGVITQNPCY